MIVEVFPFIFTPCVHYIKNFFIKNCSKLLHIHCKKTIYCFINSIQNSSQLTHWFNSKNIRNDL